MEIGRILAMFFRTRARRDDGKQQLPTEESAD